MSKVSSLITNVNCNNPLSNPLENKNLKCSYGVSYILNGQLKNGIAERESDYHDKPKAVGETLEITVDSNGNIQSSSSSMPVWQIVLIVLAVLCVPALLMFLASLNKKKKSYY
jgi:hypothetical protein